MKRAGRALPTRPQVGIGTIGYGGDSHTRLMSALSTVLTLRGSANLVPYESYLAAMSEREGWQAWRSVPHMDYATARRRYIHSYFADYEDCLRHLITGYRLQLAGVILLIDVAAGGLRRDQAFFSILRALHAPAPLLFLDHAGAIEQPDRLKEIEQDARAQLALCGLPGETAPVIHGDLAAALNSGSSDLAAPEYACLLQLLDALDTVVPLPQPEQEKPFLMPIEDIVYAGTEQKPVATGLVEHGSLRRGASVEVVGRDEERQRAIVTDFGPFLHKMERITAGDNVGCVLEAIAIQPLHLERGQVLAAPGSLRAYRSFKAAIYVPTQEETGGAGRMVMSELREEFLFWGMSIAGVVRLPTGLGILPPGHAGQMRGFLDVFIPLAIGTRFTIRSQQGRTIAVGIITDLTTLAAPHTLE